MVIVSKRNIVIPSPDGKTSFTLHRDFVGEVPTWVSKTDYFKALVDDGKIIVSKGKKEKDIEAAAKAAAEAKAKAEAEAKAKAEAEAKAKAQSGE